MAKIEISITGGVEEFFRELREKKEFKSTAEAIEYALPIAASRLKATMKYAKTHKPEPKPRKAKAPAKAKGPLARKAKSAGKGKKAAKAKPEAAPAAAPAASSVLE